MKKLRKVVLSAILVFTLAACGKTYPIDAISVTDAGVTETAEADGLTELTEIAEDYELLEPTEIPEDYELSEPAESADESIGTGTEETGIAAGSGSPDLNGSYTSAEDVALYIHTYGKLPQNFITKNEAKALGWTGGGLEEYAPGKCIGGDHFGNYEGLLPDGDYHECDIDTLGRNSRGAKRLIYSDDGAIYYTEDHYESFTQMY